MTLLFWLFISAAAAIAVGLGYLIYRFVETLIETIDRVWGPLFYLILAGTALLVCVVVLLGSAWTLLRGLAQRARSIHARDGLYPIYVGRGGQYHNFNEPGAQSLAVLAGAGRRPTAALAQRIVEGQAQRWADEQGQRLASATVAVAPNSGQFPAQVTVYDARLPRVLALPVGVDGDGQAVELPLRNLGNVLIGGLPGKGKSELLASMIAGLLRQDAAGVQQQIAIVDMKLVSFGNLPPLAALRWQVATNPEDAYALIAAARAECSRRFELLLHAQARSIEEYSARTGEKLPYLTVIVDEIVDLTQDPVRARAARFLHDVGQIARQGRAAGVSLVMATHRPSTDVIPATLRNMAGVMIAFHVQRAHDSIAILGAPGAEQLPPVPGRCLVRHSATHQVQAYMAGLEGGMFDRFCRAQPQRVDLSVPDDAVAPAGPAEPTGAPQFDDTQGEAYTAAQCAYIRQLYAALGSIKAVERHLYNQEGGYWFYRLRAVIRDEK